MKVLSIKQPWASLICTPRPDNNLLGIKDIENRSWKTNFRGRIYIHASQKSAGKMSQILTNEQYYYVKESGWKNGTYKPLSAIIGEVDIVDCVINHESIWAEKVEMPAGHYMGEKLIHNWVLANPVSYDTPILNVKGKLSFWEFTKPQNFNQ